MKKLANIALKDLSVAFRDSASLLMMLVTPFALTLVINFAFGGSSGGSLENIPVAIANQDNGKLGTEIIQVFQDQKFAVTLETDITKARALVDNNKVSAAVIIPADFSEKIVPSENSNYLSPSERGTALVEVYQNPTRTISGSIINAITEKVVSQLIASVAGTESTIFQLISEGIVSPQKAPALIQNIMQNLSTRLQQSPLITVESRGLSQEKEETSFNWLAYSAPSMAIIFLMFTVSAGARTFLAEREWGTLPRLLVTPTSAAQVIGGKMLGIFIIALAQMTILILADRFLLGVKYADWLAVALVVIALVAAATSWGMLLAAYARTPGQALVAGNALTLVFAAVAGNFIPRFLMPQWLRVASYISPNAWGLEAFTALGRGGGLGDVAWIIGGLLAMSLLLFFVSLLAFRRQYA